MDIENLEELQNRIDKLERKIDHLSSLVQSQHDHFFPSMPKRLLNWAFQHWLFLGFLLVGGYFLYEVFAFINMVNQEIQSIEMRISELIESAKFWK